MWLAWIGTVALAGYGDPVDGFPNHAERTLHYWTNVARVAPEEPPGHYAAGDCSLDDFSAEERTPKPAYLWQRDLNEAARAHTQDMSDNSFFSHTGSDGSDALTRIESYYGYDWVGENISQGYFDAEAAVLAGWMCSRDGHRGAIMDPDFTELGVGEVGNLRTQDFGNRGMPPRLMAMGLHYPLEPTLSVGFSVDWYDPGGAAPTAIEAVVNGVVMPMNLEYGAPELGMYEVAGDVPQLNCNVYHFQAQAASGEVVLFPEEGSYGWGDCNWDDEGAMWIEEQFRPGARSAGDGCGCAVGTGVGVPWLVLLAAMMGVRRRSWG